MPTNNDETPTKKTLRERTQSFRDKATRLLRMEKINSILQEIFMGNKTLSTLKKTIENLTERETSAEKIVTRAEYKITKLDPEDPDFEEKKVKAVTFVETEKIRQESTLKSLDTEMKQVTKEIETCGKTIGELSENIEKVESGEIKVSIDEVNSRTNSLIKNS
jgi:chromosome segregation ATPase